MLTSLPRRLALLVALTVPLVAHSTARAASLQVAFPDPDVVEGLPVPMRVVATGDGPLLLTRVVAKPLIPSADCSAGPLFDFEGPEFLATNDEVVDLTTSVVFDRPGQWLVCSYAAWGIPDSKRVDQIATVAVRPPHARVAVRAPRRAARGRSARVTVTFDVEAPRRLLYAAVRGGRCGLGADAARAQGARVRLLPDSVAGDGVRSLSIRFQRPGRWRVCAYVQREDGPGAANAVAGRDVLVRAHGRHPRGEFGE